MNRRPDTACNSPATGQNFIRNTQVFGSSAASPMMQRVLREGEGKDRCKRKRNTALRRWAARHTCQPGYPPDAAWAARNEADGCNAHNQLSAAQNDASRWMMAAGEREAWRVSQCEESREFRSRLPWRVGQGGAPYPRAVPGLLLSAAGAEQRTHRRKVPSPQVYQSQMCHTSTH